MVCKTATRSLQQQRPLQHQQALSTQQALPVLPGRTARARPLLLPRPGWHRRCQLSWQGSQPAPLPSPWLWPLLAAARLWLRQQADMLPCQAAPVRRRQHTQQQAELAL